MKRQESSIWGTDGVVSLPAARDPNTEMVDMEGFCFTPQGLRVNMTEIDREEFVFSGYSPVRETGETYE